MTQSRENAEAKSFAEAFEASLNFKTPEQGETLRGQIVSISGEDAYVSYGGPSEAVMAAAELEGLEEVLDGAEVQTLDEADQRLFLDFSLDVSTDDVDRLAALFSVHPSLE